MLLPNKLSVSFEKLIKNTTRIPPLNSSGINSYNSLIFSVINKNINLLPQSSEKVSAVSSLDGSGFWVVTHAQNEFYAYKVDGGGVNLPVVSNIGINIDSYDNIRGAIKLSPNGEMLAITHAIFDPSFEITIFRQPPLGFDSRAYTS